jgi:alpha-tubulin suppressor-like RCC1 family protein
MSGGTVKCWGAGRLGDGNDGGSEEPVEVVGVHDAVRVVLGGGAFTGALLMCVHRATGSVACWGYGAIGNGTTIGSAVPVELDLAGVAELAVGWGHACAVTPAGIECWGENNRGQLGNGAKGAPELAPTGVVGLATAQQLALGSSFSLARVDGSVHGWGHTASHQLGHSGLDMLEPWPVAETAGVLDVSVGRSHACGLFRAGEVRCWGDNSDGQIGVDPLQTPSAPPATVSGLGSVLQVSAGGRHSCARLADGTLRCWGDNGDGQLGLGAGAVRATSTPTEVPGLDGVAEVVAGEYHSCALLVDGRVYCWGAMGSDTDALEPRLIAL